MEERDRKLIDPSPGLAGGPQPGPPGVADGTPRPAPAEPEPDAPVPGRELDGEGALTKRETGTPGGVPGKS